MAQTLTLKAPAASASATPGAEWPLWLRLLFRFAFLYLVQFALGSNHKTIFEKVPLTGHALQTALAAPYVHTSAWLAVQVFHLTGAAAVAHASGFGDRALDWIAAGLMMLIALVGAAVWSVVDWRRRAYADVWLWLRFLLRLTLALAMFWYGAIKLWPVQIETPSLAVLNEPVGNLSPMTLLWTLLGSSHAYERICGAFETICGLLLVFRRTAFSGALLAVVIMANVVLFDFFFDVPVRLYASNLLLMALALIAPDLTALLRLLFTPGAVAVRSAWVPAVQGKVGRWAILGAEMSLLLVFAHGLLVHPQYDREAAMTAHPTALSGQWRLDASFRAGDPAHAALPFLTADGSLISDLFLEPSGRDTLRSADGMLHGGGTYAPETMTATLSTSLMALVSYRMRAPDADHLVLLPADASQPELHFTRVPLPARYPLFERGFSLSSEFGYER